MNQTQPPFQQPTARFEEAELDLTEIYFIFRRNLKKISLITAVFLFLGGFMAIMTTPVFESTATISVEEVSETLTLFDMGFEDQYNVINNEMEIIKSRSLAENVVRYLWASDSRNDLHLFGTREVKPNAVKQLVLNLISFGKAGETVDKKELTGEISDSLFTASVEYIQSNMNLKNEPNTNVLAITLPSVDAKEAALLVNTIISVYQTQDIEWASGELNSLKNFLDEQIRLLEAELNATEDSLKNFQQKEKIYGLDSDSKIILENLSTIEGEYYTTQSQINILAERQEYVESRLTEEERRLYQKLSNTISSSLTMLQNEIADAESELVLNIIQYGEDHEAVRSLEDRLEKLKAELSEQTSELITQEISATDPIRYRQSLMDTLLVFDAQNATLQTIKNEKQKLINLYEDQLNELPDKLLQFTRLQRIINVQAETYSFLVQKLDEANISRASELGKIRVIDEAIAAKRPIKPKIILNIIVGIFLGLLFGVAQTFIREFMDNTVKTTDEVERKGLSILAIIPSIGVEYKKKKRKDKQHRRRKSASVIKRSNNRLKKMQDRLITHEVPNSVLSEAYRTLRTTLMYAHTNEGKGSVLVTSSGPGEGKTTTISNLAITYANLGKRTLLIDTDLRKSIIHKVFGVERGEGITHYLAGQVSDFNSLIMKTEIENLSIVTSGVTPPNPSELLGSDKMTSLISRLEQEWDVVLFDSPPLLAVTDASMIAKHCQQLVMVVRPGTTDRSGFRRCLMILKQMNQSITGIVFNGVSEENTYGYYNYNNYYYQYYGEDHKD